SVGYAQVGDGECNTPCTSGGGYCGGAWRNSIYATGASIVDADGDGIDDRRELEIARALMPTIYPYPSEHCPAPINPKPIAFRARYPECLGGARLTDWIAINYYILYSRDCGCDSHDGDNEGFVVFGRLIDGQWQRYYQSAVAHAGTLAERHSECYGCGILFASEDKHGNYTNIGACPGQRPLCSEYCGWVPGYPLWKSTKTQLW